MRAKVFLEGAELEAFHEQEREAAELEAKHQAMLERSRRMMQADADSGSDTDSEASGDEEVTVVEGGEIKQVVLRRRVGGFTGGAGAWDEFLDPSKLEGTGGGQTFDIYVKESYAKRTGGSGGEGLQRFRMFPVVERKRRVDAYGEAIDVEGWLSRGIEDEDVKEVRTGAGAAIQVIGKRSREEEAELLEVSAILLLVLSRDRDHVFRLADTTGLFRRVVNKSRTSIRLTGFSCTSFARSLWWTWRVRTTAERSRLSCRRSILANLYVHLGILL